MLHQPTVRVGDVLESAIWLTGNEPPELVKHHKAQVEAAILEVNEKTGAVTGPVRWVEKLPGTERVPPVPKHISGTFVRLLVGEADVLNVRSSPSRFLAELEPDDLRRLRKITRDAHRLWWRRNMPLREWPRPTDKQCDTLINDLGPQAAVAALERGWTRLAGDGAESIH